MWLNVNENDSNLKFANSDEILLFSLHSVEVRSSVLVA